MSPIDPTKLPPSLSNCDWKGEDSIKITGSTQQELEALFPGCTVFPATNQQAGKPCFIVAFKSQDARNSGLESLQTAIKVRDFLAKNPVFRQDDSVEDKPSISAANMTEEEAKAMQAFFQEHAIDTTLTYTSRWLGLGGTYWHLTFENTKARDEAFAQLQPANTSPNHSSEKAPLNDPGAEEETSEVTIQHNIPDMDGLCSTLTFFQGTFNNNLWPSEEGNKEVVRKATLYLKNSQNIFSTKDRQRLNTLIVKTTLTPQEATEKQALELKKTAAERLATLANQENWNRREIIEMLGLVRTHDLSVPNKWNIEEINANIVKIAQTNKSSEPSTQAASLRSSSSSTLERDSQLNSSKPSSLSNPSWRARIQSAKEWWDKTSRKTPTDALICTKIVLEQAKKNPNWLVDDKNERIIQQAKKYLSKKENLFTEKERDELKKLNASMERTEEQQNRIQHLTDKQAAATSLAEFAQKLCPSVKILNGARINASIENITRAKLLFETYDLYAEGKWQVGDQSTFDSLAQRQAERLERKYNTSTMRFRQPSDEVVLTRMMLQNVTPETIQTSNKNNRQLVSKVQTYLKDLAKSIQDECQEEIDAINTIIPLTTQQQAKVQELESHQKNMYKLIDLANKLATPTSNSNQITQEDLNELSDLLEWYDVRAIGKWSESSALWEQRHLEVAQKHALTHRPSNTQGKWAMGDQSMFDRVARDQRTRLEKKYNTSARKLEPTDSLILSCLVLFNATPESIQAMNTKNENVIKTVQAHLQQLRMSTQEKNRLTALSEQEQLSIAEQEELDLLNQKEEDFAKITDFANRLTKLTGDELKHLWVLFEFYDVRAPQKWDRSTEQWKRRTTEVGKSYGIQVGDFTR